ncbi:citrate transporter|uniref:Citrate-Mg2+:H+ or citrate-Ca2+:H+ symporter, CitMHS family n=1 Tax=Dendrosporobacter quercicolus TaxID=146817 RepID=A0A1G9WBZ7_9FIRM|nr:citrate:proton symporter [Dendrosporobacter quercicolus]NSL47662.1 citrate transporter [Dendrosporobacter quercicolus DSM 1736]SDM81793.1 citrate-Mg2+:H+ or citrate-Ca2+:H+ symporter, CitMHS family [Dendrosporobacter quercicolus]
MEVLSILAFAMILTFMGLIMAKKMQPVTALILVPLVFAIIATYIFGYGDPWKISKWMIDGVKQISPTFTMLLFAIMYFGIMIDVGLFDPLVVRILKIVKGDPVKILVATVCTTAVVALDGDGSTTFMIIVTAFLPLYLKLGMSPVVLALFTLMTNNVLNIIPWGGPTARVMAALQLDASDVFNPLVPGMIASFIFLVILAYFVGVKERKRLGIMEMDEAHLKEVEAKITGEKKELKRPQLFWVNLVVTLCLLAALLSDKFPLGIIFAVGTSIALTINFRDVKEQGRRLAAHASEALNVVMVIIGAGCFMGILAGSKMDAALTQTLVEMIPESLGPHMALITAIISAPGTFFLSNDAFYYGIVPILAKTAAVYGITPAEIARASLMGQPIHFLSPLVGALWLLLGITNVSLADIQKYGLPVALGMMLIYIVVGGIFGAIPL